MKQFYILHHSLSRKLGTGSGQETEETTCIIHSPGEKTQSWHPRIDVYKIRGYGKAIQYLMKGVIMLKVYAAKWCPHCTQTIAHLNDNKIPFEYIEIEQQTDDIIQKIIQVNGGFDWVVPTLEFNGKWRKGKLYDRQELDSDLKKLGVTGK
jgi:mycoredoxin